MNRSLVRTHAGTVLGLLVWTSCGGKQATEIAPAAETRPEVSKRIAVLPFLDDDELEKELRVETTGMLEEEFVGELKELPGYVVIEPFLIKSVLGQEEVESHLKAFERTWLTTKRLDPEFLASLAEGLGVDAVIVGAVQVWKDQNVGAEVYLIRASDGEVLWEARNEYFTTGKPQEGTKDRIYVGLRGRPDMSTLDLSSESVGVDTVEGRHRLAQEVASLLLESFPSP